MPTFVHMGQLCLYGPQWGQLLFLSFPIEQGLVTVHYGFCNRIRLLRRGVGFLHCLMEPVHRRTLDFLSSILLTRAFRCAVGDVYCCAWYKTFTEIATLLGSQKLFGTWIKTSNMPNLFVGRNDCLDEACDGVVVIIVINCTGQHDQTDLETSMPNIVRGTNLKAIITIAFFLTSTLQNIFEVNILNQDS